MAGYTRQSTFADGDTITAALFNNEFNQLLNAFSNTSGHKHDGTVNEGPVIGLIGDAGETSPNNKVLIDTTNNYIEFYVEVSSASVQQLYIADGAIIPVTDSDIDLGTTSLRFKDTYTDTITTTGNVSVGGNLTVTGTTTFNGGTLTLGDAADDNVVFGADVNSNIIPNTDNAYDLGSSSQEWKDLYVDGIAYLDGINFNGTAITSTAAELNILDGVTSTAAELNILDGVTATAAEINLLDGVTSTTAELNILDGVTATAAEINTLDGITSTVAELNILDGVTASATDINLIDGITNGTVIASKAIVTDANKDISGGRNITITGELDAATLDISGNADIDGTLETDALSINGTTVTSTAAELNILDGVTATAAEINLLDGVTSTTAELNILDGVTSTAAELNILDGKAFLDEDDMSSNSATGIASQQSIKAYVDSTVAATNEVVEDSTPQLGGNLDLNSNNITGTGNINITGTIQSSGNITGTLATAAQPNITSLGTLTTLTVDDITIDGSVISDSGTLTIDVGSDLKLDADSSNIYLADGGSDIALLSTNNQDLNIRNLISDKDIYFQGKDGTSTITALTLDMSNAGKAIFNAGVTTTDVSITNDAANLSIQNAAADTGHQFRRNANNHLIIDRFASGSTSEVMRLDNSGNLLVNRTSTLNNAQTSIKGASGKQVLTLQTTTDGNSLIQGFNSSDALAFQVTGGGVLYASGNVGIGDTSPSSITSDVSALSLNGTNTGVSGGIIYKVNGSIKGYHYINSGNILHQAASGVGHRFLANDADAMKIDTSGNIGIGTTSPSAMLDISVARSSTRPAMSAGTLLVLESTANNTAFTGMTILGGNSSGASLLNFGDVDNEDVGQIGYHHSDNSMRFLTNASEKMRIDSSGNVGIGVSNPLSKLHVIDAAFFGTTNSGVVVGDNGGIASVYGMNAARDTYKPFEIRTGSSGTGFYQNTSGNVGIGTTSPSGKIQAVAADSQVAVMAAGDVSDPLYPAFGFDGQIGSNGGRGAGMYLPADGNLAWSTAGSERLRIDSTGNVGIGASPSGAKLQVQADGISVKLDGTANTTRSIFFRNTSSSNPAQIYADGSLRLFTEDAGTDIRFHTNSNGTNNERMRIDSSGNVGIGTTSPYHTFDVFGAVIANGQAKSNGLFFDTTSATTGTGGGIALGGYSNGTGGAIYHFGNIQGIKENSTAGNYASAMLFSTRANGATPTERMRIDSSGDVLIGQTSQTGYAFAQKLVVGDGDNNDGITIQSGSTHQGNLAFNHSDGTTAHGRISYQHGTNYMQFFTNNTEKMRIASDGKILMGVSSSYSNTVIQGKSTVAATSVYNSWNSATSGTRFHFEFRDGSSSTSQGNITTNGSGTTYATSSDYRLKNVKGSIENALERTLKLNPVVFEWKEDKKISEGFIAHEAQEIFSDAVIGEKDGEKMQTMDYGRITPLLVKAIQEQQEQIEALQSEINELKNS